MITLPTTDCTHQLAAKIAETLMLTLKQKDQASLIVSGGKSPAALFASLAKWAIPWEKVVVSLVDERCVPNHHTDSNAGQVTRQFLCHTTAHFRSLLPDPVGDGIELPTPNLLSYAQHIYKELEPADVLILGMGEDGHIASIFGQAPNYHDLLYAPATCLLVDKIGIPKNMPQHHRITWNLPAIIQVPNLFLLAYGTAKQQLIEQAQKQFDPTLPVSQLFYRSPPSLQIWLGI